MNIRVTTRTARLEMVAATLKHLQAELSGPESLGDMLGVPVPAGWPPGDYDQEALQYFKARLEDAGESAVGWYNWYAILMGAEGRRQSLVAGAGYMGPPSDDGSVEIGYAVVPEARRQGYAAEIVEFLAHRALRFHPVKTVVAHIRKGNDPSAGVLLRCGFVCTGAGFEPGTIRYQRGLEMRTVLTKLVIIATLFAAAPGYAAPSSCDRQCLYGILDQYLQALKAHDPKLVPLAPNVRTTENNVVLKIGDGLWGTITGLTGYDLRFIDPDSGGVGYYGVVQESDTASPFAVRLRVRNGRITEAETLVARPQEAGVPFVNGKLSAVPILNADVPAAERVPRGDMIRLVNGYFDTLQRNDGTIHTKFAPNCNRREDGFQTTNHPNSGYGDITALGCEAQFKLGWYRYDDRLRARRFMVIDEERGLVMAAGFIDHAGRFGDYKLTDGRTAKNYLFRHPHTYCLLETFKIQNGQIQQVEAVFTNVPYRMPSPWGGTPDVP